MEQVQAKRTTVIMPPTTRAADERPKRPLSAYNYFFRCKRERMLLEETDFYKSLDFTGLSRYIGTQWKNTDTSMRIKYQKMAARDKKRYALELIAWQEAQDQFLSDLIEQDNLDEDEDEIIETNQGAQEDPSKEVGQAYQQVQAPRQVPNWNHHSLARVHYARNNQVIQERFASYPRVMATLGAHQNQVAGGINNKNNTVPQQQQQQVAASPVGHGILPKNDPEDLTRAVDSATGFTNRSAQQHQNHDHATMSNTTNNRNDFMMPFDQEKHLAMMAASFGNDGVDYLIRALLHQPARR